MSCLYMLCLLWVYALFAGGNILEIIDILDLGAQIPFSQLCDLGEASVCFILLAPEWGLLLSNLLSIEYIFKNA